jgi:hypothetical protein
VADGLCAPEQRCVSAEPKSAGETSEALDQAAGDKGWAEANEVAVRMRRIGSGGITGPLGERAPGTVCKHLIELRCDNSSPT